MGDDDRLWPMAWVTYSRPSESFAEVSERWEQERLDRSPVGHHWWFIGGAVGLILAIINGG